MVLHDFRDSPGWFHIVRAMQQPLRSTVACRLIHSIKRLPRWGRSKTTSFNYKSHLALERRSRLRLSGVASRATATASSRSQPGILPATSRSNDRIRSGALIAPDTYWNADTENGERIKPRIANPEALNFHNYIVFRVMIWSHWRTVAHTHLCHPCPEH